MPNKSDSAGKLHQYYTCKYLVSKNLQAKFNSPLEDSHKRQIHEEQFNKYEILSLKNIGELTGDEILQFASSNLATITDIGETSGAVGFKNTDDIRVITTDGTIHSFSLKCATSLSQILSKNMGAKSLLKDYFNAVSEQQKFNSKLEKHHLTFFETISKQKSTTIREARKIINDFSKTKGNKKPRFTDSHFPTANKARDEFLRNLKDELKSSLESLGKKNLAKAVNIILDTGKNHLLGNYSNNKENVVYVRIPDKTEEDIVSVRTRGNDAIVIVTNDYEVGFRYKFESSITSSIKLVGDYKKI